MDVDSVISFALSAAVAICIDDNYIDVEHSHPSLDVT